jgi:hypothetical protein
VNNIKSIKIYKIGFCHGEKDRAKNMIIAEYTLDEIRMFEISDQIFFLSLINEEIPKFFDLLEYDIEAI